MKNIKFLPVVLAVVLTSLSLQAQNIKVNKKPGAVSLDEVCMTSYQMDSAAHAVYLVLSETSDMQALVKDDRYTGFGIQKQAQDYFSIVTKYYMRIKVLDKAGLDYADFEFFLKKNKALADIYKGLKVVTYNVNGNKLVATKMDKSAVRESSLDAATDVVRFTAPDVRVGSVIEAQWEVRKDGGLEMPQLLMQRDLPINFGEFTVNIPSPVFYAYNLSGVDAASCRHTYEAKGVTNVEHFLVCDMPAFKREPMCDAADRYKTRATYNLKSISYAETYEQSMYHSVNKPARTTTFNESWEAVDKVLYESDVVKGMTSDHRFATEVDAIVGRAQDEEQTIRDIRNMVMENVSWNGLVDIVPGGLVESEGRLQGNNADINVLVASCLSRAGFTVCPIFLKLRSSGFISGVDMEQFDTFVIYAEKEGKYVLDAADPAGYINLLPRDMLSTQLRFINNSVEGQWLDLGTLSNNTETYNVLATVQADGALKAKVSIKFQGENSYDFKRYYRSFASHEEFTRAFAGKFGGYAVESCKVQGVDQWSDNAAVELDLGTKLSEQEDGSILIDPFVCELADADFLCLERRKLPFEFSCTESLKYTFTLNLDASHKIVEVPESYKLYNKELKWMAGQTSTTLGSDTFSLLFTTRRDANYASNIIFPQLKTFWVGIHDIMQVKVKCRSTVSAKVSE